MLMIHYGIRQIECCGYLLVGAMGYYVDQNWQEQDLQVLKVY